MKIHEPWRTITKTYKNNKNSWYTMIGNGTIEHTWQIAIHSLNNSRIDQSVCDLLVIWPSMIGIITLSGTALLISCRFTNPTICKVGVSKTTLGRIMFGLPDLPVSTIVEFSIGKWTPPHRQPPRKPLLHFRICTFQVSILCWVALFDRGTGWIRKIQQHSNNIYHTLPYYTTWRAVIICKPYR